MQKILQSQLMFLAYFQHIEIKWKNCHLPTKSTNFLNFFLCGLPLLLKTEFMRSEELVYSSTTDKTGMHISGKSFFDKIWKNMPKEENWIRNGELAFINFLRVDAWLLSEFLMFRTESHFSFQFISAYIALFKA